ncbi:MAG: nucleotidyltransferase [Candidatus Nanohalarchaeota archaeon]|nr:MAG: nucleotidyltransferase [Candidatus Nanohaloarchaeota archaeon]
MNNQEVTKIAEEIRKHFPDAKIILFGSRAKGTHLKTSDIDLIVISKKFENIHFTQRTTHILKILYKSKTLPKVGLDILCYTPEEFEKKKKEIGIIKEAVMYGKEI